MGHTHIMSIADSAIPSSKLFDYIKKVNGIFEMNVKSGSNEATYTIDLKKEGKVYKGPAKPKADVTISLADDVFQQLADGKINGQKASCRASSRSAATSCSQPS